MNAVLIELEIKLQLKNIQYKFDLIKSRKEDFTTEEYLLKLEYLKTLNDNLLTQKKFFLN